MDSTTLSSKGQVIIPKAVREAQQWPPGTVFRVEAREGGVLLTPQPLFAPTRAAEVAGCLKSVNGEKGEKGAAKARPTRSAMAEGQALRRRAKAEDRATRP